MDTTKTFNHDSENTYEACGLDEDTVNKKIDEVLDDEDSKYSKMIEKIVKTADSPEEAVMLAMIVSKILIKSHLTTMFSGAARLGAQE